MKKRIIISAIVLIAMVTFCVYTIWFSAKYNKCRDMLSGHPFYSIIMDKNTSGLLKEITESWNCRSVDIDGAHSYSLQYCGLAPTVKNLASLLTYEMPEYSWILLYHNYMALKMGRAKGVLLPKCIGNAIYISTDEHTAIIRLTETFVIVFSDDNNRMKESYYTKRAKNI